MISPMYVMNGNCKDVEQLHTTHCRLIDIFFFCCECEVQICEIWLVLLLVMVIVHHRSACKSKILTEKHIHVICIHNQSHSHISYNLWIFLLLANLVDFSHISFFFALLFLCRSLDENCFQQRQQLNCLIAAHLYWIECWFPALVLHSASIFCRIFHFLFQLQVASMYPAKVNKLYAMDAVNAVSFNSLKSQSDEETLHTFQYASHEWKAIQRTEHSSNWKKKPTKKSYPSYS